MLADAQGTTMRRRSRARSSGRIIATIILSGLIASQATASDSLRREIGDAGSLLGAEPLDAKTVKEDGRRPISVERKSDGSLVIRLPPGNGDSSALSFLPGNGRRPSVVLEPDRFRELISQINAAEETCVAAIRDAGPIPPRDPDAAVPGFAAIALSKRCVVAFIAEDEEEKRLTSTPISIADAARIRELIDRADRDARRRERR
jgi:hypothetical protein